MKSGAPLLGLAKSIYYRVGLEANKRKGHFIQNL